MSFLYLLLLALIAVLLQRYSIAHCLDGLHYDLTPEKQLVECDETISIKTTVQNTKRKPVLYLRIAESVPRKMSIDLNGTSVQRRGTQCFSASEHDEIRQTVYLMPKQALTRSLNVSLPDRGRYFFRSASMTSGDLLGLKEQTKKFDFYKEIVVKPKRADVPELDYAFGNYMGDISVRRYILSDPILTVGYRDYTGREPQRDISWTATLRSGNRLMVKQYDFTAEITVNVLLDIHNGTEEEIERTYSYTRTICEMLEDKHVSYGFLTDAPCADSVMSWNHISIGLGERHLSVILEGLGRATYSPARSLESVLLHAENECATSNGFVLITPKLDAEGLELLRRFEARNMLKVMLIETAQQYEEEAAV